MTARTNDADRPPRILLVRLSAIGDCLHALPVATALRLAHPDAFIGWAIQEPAATLLRGAPAIDRFHIYPRRAGGFANQVASLARLRRELRDCRYDTAIDVQGLTKSGLVAWLSGARQRIGFGGGRTLGSRELNFLFLNRRFEVDALVAHVVDRNLALLEAAGIAPGVEGAPTWQLPDYAEPATLSFLKQHGLGAGSYVVTAPGTTWGTKHWPVDHFAAAARDISRATRLPNVVVWAGDQERQAAERIVSANDTDDSGRSGGAVLAPPTDLRELATLIQNAALFVGCDSGPAHLAAALDTPCVSVFGPTDPARNGPYGARSRSVRLEPPLDCQPCWRRTCSRGDHACMERLDPDQVVAACLEQAAPGDGQRRAPAAPEEWCARRDSNP